MKNNDPHAARQYNIYNTPALVYFRQIDHWCIEEDAKGPNLLYFLNCLSRCFYKCITACHPKGLGFDSWTGHLVCGHFIVMSCTLGCFHSCPRLKLTFTIITMQCRNLALTLPLFYTLTSDSENVSSAISFMSLFKLFYFSNCFPSKLIRNNVKNVKLYFGGLFKAKCSILSNGHS